MSTEINYKILLHYWDNVPAVSDSTQLKLFRSGHVALEVKKDGVTEAYLGWWPRSYTVQRERTKRPLFQKCIDKLLLWFTPVEGRFSSYATVQDAKAVLQKKPTESLNPDRIDSVLVGNKPRGDKRERRETIDDWQLDQEGPSFSREIKGESLVRLDPTKVLNTLNEFREEAEKKGMQYQFLFNNCTTVIAEVLKRSGYPIGYGPWWPSRLLSMAESYFRER